MLGEASKASASLHRPQRWTGGKPDEVQPGVSRQDGVLESLPSAVHLLDAAITVNTAHLVEDLHAAFRQLARVLEPNGQLVVGLDNPLAMACLTFTSPSFALRPIEMVSAALAPRARRDRHDQLGTGRGAAHLLRARPIERGR